MAPGFGNDRTLGRGQVAKNIILMGEQIISYAHTAHVNWQYVGRNNSGCAHEDINKTMYV